MNYIKKLELKKLVIERLRTLFEKGEFKFLSSKNRFFKNINGGLIMIDFRVIDAYNFVKNDIAWKVELTYFIGFEAVHKWFEPYEDRDKKDYKYYWTCAKGLNVLCDGIFQIDVDDLKVDLFLDSFIKKVKYGYDLFYNNYNHLDKLNEAIIPYPIRTIEDINRFDSFSARNAIESIAIAWILQRDDFNTMVDVFRLKLKEYSEIGDPTSKLYYSQLDNIIEALQNIDFSSYPLFLEIPPLPLVCD